MQLWATMIKNNKIIKSYTLDVDAYTRSDVYDWETPIGEICRELDLARPILLKKHYNDMNEFSHTTFIAADFMEPIKFDKLRIEIIHEKKKNE